MFYELFDLENKCIKIVISGEKSYVSWSEISLNVIQEHKTDHFVRQKDNFSSYLYFSTCALELLI